jgi:hypothetical protein
MDVFEEEDGGRISLAIFMSRADSRELERMLRRILPYPFTLDEGFDLGEYLALIGVEPAL